MGHLRVTVGQPRATMGHLRLTIGYLKATVVHIRVTLGHLKVTIGNFFSELHPKVRPTCLPFFGGGGSNCNGLFGMLPWGCQQSTTTTTTTMTTTTTSKRSLALFFRLLSPCWKFLLVTLSISINLLRYYHNRVFSAFRTCRQGGYDGRGKQSCKCNYVDFSKWALPPCWLLQVSTAPMLTASSAVIGLAS